jgi:hypothetical protein
MKTILSALIAITLACSATAQDYGALIFNHRIAIGMSFANVQAAWGNPASVDRSTSNYGVSEVWWFNNGYVVVFFNGRVEQFYQLNINAR